MARRTGIFIAVGLSIASLSVIANHAPRVLWNATASAPVGLYWVTPGAGARGDLVAARTPESARELVAERGYLPIGVPLVKRIAGVSGDTICAANDVISVNGAVVAQRLEHDSQGRSMPVWNGCRTLADEVFLLMHDVSASFDGRYFGPVSVTSVIGKVTPLWTH